MPTLRFRVSYEEDDTIFRDIEMLPNQTFADMHQVIAAAYNLTAEGKSVMYKSNDQWQKLDPIPLTIPEPKKEESKKKAAPKKKADKKEEPVKAPRLAVILSYIDGPHQKFFMNYTGKMELEFLIELISLTGVEKPGNIYPFVTRTEGPSPMKKEEMSKFIGTKPELKEEYAVDNEDDELTDMGTEGEEETMGSNDKEDGGEDSEFADDENEEFKDDFGEMDGHF